MSDLSTYNKLLQFIKSTIKQGQYLAYSKVNTVLIGTYFEIGKIIIEKKIIEGRGAKVVDQLSSDLTIEFGNNSGYGIRNLKYMLKFYETYKNYPIVQQLVAQLPRGQNIAIMDRCETIEEKEFYIKLCIEKGLSRNVLIHQIEGNAYVIAKKQGTNNFNLTIPEESDLAKTIIKDEYILDFLFLKEPFAERQLERSLIENIKQFLLELGNDFCFMGNQYKLTLNEKGVLCGFAFLS